MSNIIGKRIKRILRKWRQFFNEIRQYVACSEGATLTERSISFLRIQAPHVSEANIGPEQLHRHKLVPTPSPAAHMVGTALSKTSKEAGLGLV